MFPTPAVDGRNPGAGLGLGAGTFRRWKSRVRGLSEFGGEIPVVALAEEILTPGEGQIKGMFIAAGNPVLSTPNGQQVDRALGSLDFLVCLDIYLNETSRHAHIILPPCSPLERPHYDLALQMVAVRNTAKFSEALFKAPDGQMEDGWVIMALLKRLERLRHGRLSKRWLQAKAMQAAGIERVLDLGLRTGPYGYKARGLSALTLKQLKNNPHGVDLGPLVPASSDLLPFGRDEIDIAPKEFVADLERLEARYPAGGVTSSDLILIGRRQLRSNNSWMHNIPRLMRGKDRCTLMMHPQDAQRLGLSDGGKVRIESRVGSISAPLEVTEDLMPGVVSLPHGFGHNKKGTRLKTAESNPGVSVNDLTDELLLDTMSGNAALSGVAVKVTAQVAEQAAE